MVPPSSSGFFMNAESPVADWSLPRKILFRLLFAYFVLYILPFPLSEAAQFEVQVRQWTGLVQPM